MTHGRPTDEKTVLKFRKEFLNTANASESARRVGLPETTGCEIARRLEKDPEFVRERNEMRARILPEVEAVLREAVKVAAKQIQGKHYTPEDIARIASEYDLKSLSWRNEHPAYMKAAADIHRTLTHRRTVLPDKVEGARQEQTLIKIVAPAGSAVVQVNEGEEDDD